VIRGANQQEERARLVEDFISRKKEAAINKQRGQAQLFGPSEPRQQTPGRIGMVLLMLLFI